MIRCDTRDDILELRYALMVLEYVATVDLAERPFLKTVAGKAAGGLRARVEAKVFDPLPREQQ